MAKKQELTAAEREQRRQERAHHKYLRWLAQDRDDMTAQPEATIAALRRERADHEAELADLDCMIEQGVTCLDALTPDPANWTDAERDLVGKINEFYRGGQRKLLWDARTALLARETA